MALAPSTGTMFANRAAHIFSDNAMMHIGNFCNTDKKKRQWTSSLEKRLRKQLQRKKNELRARDGEG